MNNYFLYIKYFVIFIILLFSCLFYYLFQQEIFNFLLNLLIFQLNNILAIINLKMYFIK